MPWEPCARDYRSLMPTNLYGPHDNFHPENSHVIPALIRRIHEAMVAGTPEVVIWGTGAPRREFLHVDDLAAACVHVLELDPSIYRQITCPMMSHINVGSGVDCTIRELAETIARVIGFSGRLQFDSTKPDGTPRKLLDITKTSHWAGNRESGWKRGCEVPMDGFCKTRRVTGNEQYVLLSYPTGQRSTRNYLPLGVSALAETGALILLRDVE